MFQNSIERRHQYHRREIRSIAAITFSQRTQCNM